MSKYVLPFILSLLAVHYLPAQLSPLPYQQPGNSLQQSFNGLPVSGTFSLTGKGPHPLYQLPVPTTGLQGWYILQIDGSQPNTNFSVSTGSATGSGVYSYGASGNANRSLGSLASGTGVYGFGLILKNETGLILNRIQIRFLATQWRKGGSGNKNTWRFGYQQGDTVRPATDTSIKDSRFDFGSIHSSTGATTLNGHQPANQVWIEDSINTIFWLPGQELLLQWTDFDETGSDDAMAIDDFSFKAFQQAGLPVISEVKTDSISARKVAVSALVNDQLSNTSVDVEIDTSFNLLTASTLQNIIPGLIAAGSRNVKVGTQINQLLPAKKYYYRFIARNQQGISYGSVEYFITKAELPVISTDSLVKLSDNSCAVFGSIRSNGGDSILERGICWALDSFPAINQNSLLIAGTDTNFHGSIFQLPSGTKIFFRTYCKNSAGIAYGNVVSWFTPTSIVSFKRNGSHISNKDTIVYQIQFKEKVEGIGPEHFQILTNSFSDARIIELREINLSWQLTIHTGNKDGSITPVFLHHNLYEPQVINTPFSANTTIIDKTGPQIHTVQLQNRPYKPGDTVVVFIDIKPEKNPIRMVSGNLQGYPLQQLHKLNDSNWKAFCVIKNSGQEISAEEDIEATIVLSDEAGNQNNIVSFIIKQNNDAIDLTRPAIERIFIPSKSLLKSGDSLLLQVQFTEAVILDSLYGSPLLSVTIGTRIRNPFLYQISPKNVFTFCYIIQPDELDMDGIRIASSITLNNAIITDRAGNLLNNNIPNAGVFSNFRVDAVAPVITTVTTPIARTYGIGDSLYFNVFVSEPPVIHTTTQFPKLEITVGNTLYHPIYLSGSNNPLRFYWVVQKGISDKNGLSISNLLINSEGITDSSGNKIEPVLKNIGSLSNVFIDGILPVFKDSIAIVQVCINGETSLSDALKIDSAEAGETLSWTILSAPLNGSIQGLPFSTKWVNGNQLTAVISYTPTLITSGFDECIIQVSDGVNTNNQKIKIQVNPPISNNTITADQMICAGFSAQPLQGKTINGGNGIYEFIWESGSDNSTFQKAPGVYNKETYHPLNMHSSKTFRRIVSSGACSDTSDNVLIEVRSSGLWLGQQSNSWNIGGNWCGGTMPDRQTDVFITEADSRNFIEVNDSAFCKSLFIHPSQLLRITGSLLFTGSLSGSANIDVSKGVIISGGKEKQLLHTSIFTNKSVAGLIAAGTELELSDTLFIQDYFSIQKGILNSNDLLFLSNKATNHPNAPGTILKGRVSTTRNIAGRQRELFIHHPFKNNLSVHLSPDSNFLQNKGFVFFTSGFSASDSIYMINSIQPINKNAVSFKWQSFETGKDTLWPAGRGITLSNPAQPSLNKNPITLFFNGTGITGDTEIEFPNGADSNYLLTGNPYLSPINSKFITKSDGIGNYYWVWDTSLATHGAYRTKAFAANNTIVNFEGFIIKTISDRPLFLSYSEQSKQIIPIPDSLEDCIENTHQFEIELIKDSILHDKLLILDVDSARTRYDAADAEKIMNPESNLYTLSADTIPLSVDARWMTNRTYIPLGIHTKVDGPFIFRFSRVWLKPGIEIELYDSYTGNKIKIDTNKTYHFTITKDTESFGRNRFVIRSPQKPDPPEEVLELQLYPVPATHILNITLQAREKANTRILIKNVTGQLILSQNMGEQQTFTQQIPVSSLLKGHYIAEVHSGKYVIAKTFIKL
ncbi:T9SS type A sorting domain-containing protein [Sediminibacterium sp.]|uniref:T9SS type A sorting domain-containing protein n=1 Tax=Sediminibacterium sp. TaxID=1917865 RepID=UPI0025FB120E|nr:T9SS type A sorting domain-containing protein [Sediminibacterium sp.]MBW0176350.1 T9SS type A sorting domain-containing protein [Sediminibacterium sp.]